ncbi:MAG: DNA repair protein RecN [Candidatus Omnitrophota bacterium]
MLQQIHIENFALIDGLTIDFSEGFHVLTGETGAGKSILIDALQNILGERLENHQIRDKERLCVLQGTFQAAPAIFPENSQLRSMIGEDHLLILRREVGPDGRSRNYINGAAATVQMLKEAGRALVDIHGQSDHQSLFEVASHLRVIDRFAEAGKEGDAFRRACADFGRCYAEYLRLEARRKEIESKAEIRDREIELLKYQTEEISSVAPKPGELSEIKAEWAKTAHREKLLQICERILLAMSDGEVSVSTLMANAAKEWAQWERIDDSVRPWKEVFLESRLKLDELAAEVQRYRESLGYDPAQLAEIEERMARLEQLEKKYGGSIEAALEFLERAKRQLDEIQNAEVYREEIKESLKKNGREMARAMNEMTRVRKATLAALSQAIERELQDLGFKEVRFCFEWVQTEPGPSGQDAAQFLFGPNPGEPLMPLSKIASGGEAARVMLAIKAVLAKADAVPTLLFDEIDANIGGRLGQKVGEKIRTISRSHQVILITHLPQIASFAVHHYKVEKQAEGKRTQVRCRRLSEPERVREVSQMMDGESDTEISKAHARQMLRTPSR